MSGVGVAGPTAPSGPLTRGETLAAVGLVLVAAASRLALLPLAEFAEVNYEEATVGVMARHILQGDHVVFWWGEPYLGTSQTYLVALLFTVLPKTTRILRIAPLVFSLVAAFFAYRLARDLAGPRWSLLTLLWWTVPPAFLTRYGLTPFNYISCVAYGSIILYLTQRAAIRGTGAPTTWYLLGLFWGLAVWDHLISVAYVAASGAWLSLRAWRRDTPGPARGWLPRCAVGFIVGSSPFWGWNLLHRFETITEMITPAAAPRGELLGRLDFVVRALMVELLGRADWFWADGRGTAHLIPLLGLVYLPLLPLSAYWLCRQAIGPTPRAAPQPGSPPVGLDLVAASLFLAVAQVVFTSYNNGRYLMPIYSSVPVLLAVYARWLACRARWLPALLIVALVLVDVTDNVKVIEASVRRRDAPRPVDAVIRRLREEGIGHVYAHYRVAWTLAFESEETITASDFYGYLTNRFALSPGSASYMAPYLRDMAEVDAAPRVALVTHERLRIPTAAELAETLTLLGGTYRRSPVGLYTIFHDFQPPARHLREIPASQLTLRTSHAPELAARALDRDIGTRWQSGVPQAPGMVVEVELERPRRVAKIVLDPGSHVNDFPAGLRVEVSPDGTAWQDVVHAPGHLGGIDWFASHPKLNLRGKLGLWIGPMTTKAVRLTQIAVPGGTYQWGIAELVLFEEAPPGAPPDLATLLRGDALSAIVRFVTENGITRVFSPDEAGVLLARALPPSVQGVALRDPKFLPVDRSERVVRFRRRTAFLLASDDPELREALRRHGIPAKRHEVAGTVLYVTEPRPGATPLYWDYGRLLALSAG